MLQQIKSMTIDPRYKYYAISAVSLAIISFSIYFLLGGTKEYEVQESGAVSYDIVGTPFKGRYVADSARMVFEDIRSKIINEDWKGDLVELTYPPEDGDEINQFFGVLLTGRVTQIEGNYKLKKLRAPGSLTVKLSMHWLVRPSREKIQTMIFDYAQERGIALEDFFMQRYLPDNSVTIEAFVK
jgi:hypothetical protein